MSTWTEQHSCGSASSRVAPASRRSSCGRGSGATACSRRSAPPAATGSTRRTTSSGCDGCGSCSERGSRRPRRPGRPAPSHPPWRKSRRRRLPLPSSAAHSSNSTTPPPTPRSTACWPTTRREPCSAGVVLPLLHELGAGLGARRDLRRAGALRLEPAPRSPARPCARVGPRLGPTRGARVSAGRAARSGARDLRALTPGARLADHVPGRRHAARHDRRDSGAARAGGARPRRHGRRTAGGRGETPLVASATPPRPSGSAARERGHSTGALVLEGSALEAAEQVSR